MEKIKSIICLVLMVLFVLSVDSFAETKNKLQKFDATITIQYKNLTLKQIADMEKKIKEAFDSAESIKIELDKEKIKCYENWRYSDQPMFQLLTSPITTVPAVINTPMNAITDKEGNIIHWD